MSFNWITFFTEFVVISILIRILINRLDHVIQKRRQVSASRSKLTVDYNHIARLEIELFGKTLENDGSPVKSGLTDLYGIAERKQSAIDESKKLVTRQVAWNPQESPLPDFQGNPNWTDEDGRPW